MSVSGKSKKKIQVHCTWVWTGAVSGVQWDGGHAGAEGKEVEMMGQTAGEVLP